MINNVFKCYSWVTKCSSLFILLCERNFHAQLAEEMLFWGISMGKRDGRACILTFIHVMTFMYNSRACTYFLYIFYFPSRLIMGHQDGFLQNSVHFSITGVTVQVM